MQTRAPGHPTGPCSSRPRVVGSAAPSTRVQQCPIWARVLGAQRPTMRRAGSSWSRITQREGGGGAKRPPSPQSWVMSRARSARFTCLSPERACVLRRPCVCPAVCGHTRAHWLDRRWTPLQPIATSSPERTGPNFSNFCKNGAPFGGHPLTE